MIWVWPPEMTRARSGNDGTVEGFFCGERKLVGFSWADIKESSGVLVSQLL